MAASAVSTPSSP
ncbi:hypothetical protein YPPY53_1872, partial [Yersinia pestis PY-53]